MKVVDIIKQLNAIGYDENTELTLVNRAEIDEFLDNIKFWCKQLNAQLDAIDNCLKQEKRMERGESIDIEKLNEKIAEFPITKAHNPYIFMNEDTMRELIAKIIIKYPSDDITIKGGYRVGVYQGNKVFIDDTKSFGEVELR